MYLVFAAPQNGIYMCNTLLCRRCFKQRVYLLHTVSAVSLLLAPCVYILHMQIHMARGHEEMYIWIWNTLSKRYVMCHEVDAQLWIKGARCVVFAAAVLHGNMNEDLAATHEELDTICRDITDAAGCVHSDTVLACDETCLYMNQPLGPGSREAALAAHEACIAMETASELSREVDR